MNRIDLKIISVNNLYVMYLVVNYSGNQITVEFLLASHFLLYYKKSLVIV